MYVCMYACMCVYPYTCVYKTQVLRKRRRTKHSKKKIEKEGEGENLAGSELEDLEEEQFEETNFNYDSYIRKFANFQVVAAYTWMIGKFKVNSQQVCVANMCVSPSLSTKECLAPTW